MLHDWGVNGYDAAEKKHINNFAIKNRYRGKENVSFRQVVRGKIEYLGMIRGKDDPMYVKFMRKLSELDPKVKFEDMTVTAKAPRKIFISHASEDTEIAREIYHRLKTIGYNPWLDVESIPGGVNWDAEINYALTTADFVVLIISETSAKKRGYIQKEIQTTLDKLKEKLERDIFLIPLLIEDCEIPSEVSKYHAIKYFENDGWNRLTQSLQEGVKRLED